MGAVMDVGPSAARGSIPRLLSRLDAGRSELLGLAVRHASHVHEHGGLAGEGRALRALAHVGSTFVTRSAALRVYPHADQSASGGISEQVARIEGAFAAWADGRGGAEQWSLLGRGQPLQPSVARDLVAQVLGALCLEGRYEDARSVLNEFFEFASEIAPEHDDTRTLLPADVQEIDVTRSGPDHEPSFRITLADARARAAQGRASSKSAARGMAARRWLETYCPERLAAPPGPRPSMPISAPSFVAAGPAHQRGVERAMMVLGIPAAGHAVMSQALILPSWAYENAQQVRSHRQRDHRALAAVGSRVLPYEFALLRLQGRDLNSLVDTELSLPSRHVSAQAARQLLLTEGILSGRGEPVAGLSDSTLENVLQATVAAAALARSVQTPILTTLPERWTGVFRNSVAVEVDFVTALDRFTSAFRLTAAYATTEEGPDHDRRFRATVSIRSELITGGLGVSAKSDAQTKSAARQTAARHALGIIDAAAARGRFHLTADRDQKGLVGYVQRHLTELRAQTTEHGLRRLESVIAASRNEDFCRRASIAGRVPLRPGSAPAVGDRPTAFTATIPVADREPVVEKESTIALPDVPDAREVTEAAGTAGTPDASPATAENAAGELSRFEGPDAGPDPSARAGAATRKPGPRRRQQADPPWSEEGHAGGVDANAYHAFLDVQAGDDLIGRVEEQLGDWLRKQKSWDPPTSEDGFLRGPDDQELLILHREAREGRDFRARLREQQSTGTWTTTLTVHDDALGGRSWVSLRVSNSQSRLVAVPRLAGFLIDALEARDGDTWLSATPRTIRLADVETFADELSSVERQGLYFVAGTGGDQDPAPFHRSVAAWTRGTIGLAQVAILDPEATTAFADIMGRHHRVPAWTLRTFKPDVDPALEEEDGRRHRILGAHRLTTDHESATRSLLSRVARRHVAEQPRPRRFVPVDQALTRLEDRLLVADLDSPVAASTPVVHPPELPSVIDIPSARSGDTPQPPPPVSAGPEAAQQLGVEIERYLAQIELVKASLGIEELSAVALDDLARQAALGRKSIAATDRLTRELEERRALVEDLTEQLDYHQQLNDEQEVALAIETEARGKAEDENRWLRGQLREVAAFQAANAVLPAEGITEYPQDFSELADRLVDGELPNVVFTGNAKIVRDLEEQDQLGRIAHVAWEALLALSDYVRARVAGECTRGFKDYLVQTPAGYRGLAPNKFAEGETAATMAAFGDDRRFPLPVEVDGSGWALMEPHVKLGKVGMVSPRLHFVDDFTRSGAIYVGYIGPHLRNTQTN